MKRHHQVKEHRERLIVIGLETRAPSLLGHILIGTGLPKAKLPYFRAPLHTFHNSRAPSLKIRENHHIGIVWAAKLQGSSDPLLGASLFPSRD